MTKNNKFFAKLALCVFSLNFFCFISCKTSQVEVQEQHFYTDADALNDEIDSIKSISEKDSLKALWRIFLLKERLFDENKNLEQVNEFYNQQIKKCTDEYNDCVSSASGENDYFKAQRILRSFEALGIDESENLLMDAKTLSSKILAFVPKLKSAKNNNFSFANMGEMIKGTVTVYVDKGIKIERGSGYVDAVLGSGFFITSDGYIVTNHHVISDLVEKKYEGYSRLYIKLAEDPDTRIPAKVVGYDSTLDLALLKTEIQAPYVFALASSSSLQVGDKVYAIGSPLGLEKTLTSGIISSVDRQLFSAGHVFQLDAAVNSGNSGGPLIDENGIVQAIVFAGVPNYQGLNFAIPVDYLNLELPFLFRGGEKTHPWTCSYGRTKKLPGSGTANEGVTVNYVMNNGSSFRSGIKEDDVIVSVDNQKVSTLDELQMIFMKYEASTIVKLGVLGENSKLRDAYLYLEKRPENPGYQIYSSDLLSNSLYPLVGLRLVNSSTFSKRKFNVTKVLKGSTADEAGFSENDPIEVLGVEINDEKSAAYIKLYAKRKQKGYLDVSIALPVSFDSPYYF